MPLVRRRKKVENRKKEENDRRGIQSSRTKTELYRELHTATGKPHKQIAILTGFLRQEICLPNGSDPERLFGQVGRMVKIVGNPFELADLLLQVKRRTDWQGLWDPLTYVWRRVFSRAGLLLESEKGGQNGLSNSRYDHGESEGR